ncbi:MAG TPA: Uma2 family endonuclease [Planctomycetota bacterium]|jgi:Uma2 family endonuclease
MSADLMDKLKQSPQLPKYVERAQRYLEEERRRREAFYEQIREDQKAEFINGEVIVHSPAQVRHTATEGNIYKLLDTYVQRHEQGWVGFEKVLICLARNDYEPDVVYFGPAKAGAITPEQQRLPAPDLVVEVLSPSTESTDRGTKFEDYAANSVMEYWIVDPASEVVEQYLLKGEGYQLALKSGSGELRSTAIEGLVLPIRAFFDRGENLKALQTIVGGT